MSLQIPIKVSHLKAVSLCAGDKDIRYYLNGVLVEVTPTAIRLCATDGHVLALTHTPQNWGVEPPAPCQFIIPNDTVKAAIKAAGKCDHVFVEVGNDAHILRANGATAISFEPVNGRFPDYVRVIPRTCSGEIGAYDPDLLMRFQKAKKVYDRRFPIEVEHNGNGPALIHAVDEEFIGVIMPFKPEGSQGAPAWVHGEDAASGNSSPAAATE